MTSLKLHIFGSFTLLFGKFQLIPNATGLTTVTKYMGERDEGTPYAERETKAKIENCLDTIL